MLTWSVLSWEEELGFVFASYRAFTHKMHQQFLCTMVHPGFFSHRKRQSKLSVWNWCSFGFRHWVWACFVQITSLTRLRTISSSRWKWTLSPAAWLKLPPPHLICIGMLGAIHPTSWCDISYLCDFLTNVRACIVSILFWLFPYFLFYLFHICFICDRHWYNFML